MGCDIHFVVEKATNLGWVGVYSTDLTPGFPTHQGTNAGQTSHGYDRGTTLRDRNYGVFAKLAGVRGPGPEAKGIPDDASSLTNVCSSVWGGDGHSHSYCSLQDFVTARMNDAQFADFAAAELDRGDRTNATLAYWVGYADDNIADYRVVFWFDN